MILDQCCNCNPAPQCLSVSRRVGGFAEYIITHDTHNPITYFVGRSYRQASFDHSLVQAMAVSCDGTTTSGSPLTVDNATPCNANFTLNYTSTFSELINQPGESHSGNGCECDGGHGCVYPDVGANWHTDGYYSLFAGGHYLENGFDLFGSYTPAQMDANDLFVYPSSISASCNAPAPCSNPDPDWDRTSSTSFSGAGLSTSGSIVSPTVWSKGVACNCVKSLDWVQGPCSGAVTTYAGWYKQTSNFTDTITATLSNEVDYDSVIGSVLAGVEAAALIAIPGCPECYANYGFNDFPIDEGGDLMLDPMIYDGALTKGIGLGFAIDSLDCAGGWSGAPHLVDHAFAVTWFHLGGVDTPGVDPADTFICAIGNRVTVTAPYILVDYLVMNGFNLLAIDYTPVGGTYANCRDGVAFGSVRVPQPDIRSTVRPLPFPPELFGVDGDGNLTGPIGIMTVLIPNMTCEEWDHATPS